MSLLPTAARRIEAPEFALGAARWTGARHLTLQLGLGVVVAIAYTVTLATVGPNGGTPLVASAIIAAVVAVIWPIAGFATVAFLIPVREPEILNPIYVDAVLIGATAFGCLLRLAGDRRPVRVHPGIILVVGYGLFSASSILPQVTGHPVEWASSAAFLLIHMVIGIALFAIASYLFRYVPTGPVIAIAMAGAGLASVVAIVAYLDVRPILAVFEGLLEPLRGARASGGFSTANYFGFFAVQALILAVGSWSSFRARFRPLVFVLVVLFVAAVLLSYSRQSYIAAAIGLVVLVAIRYPKAALVLAVLAVGIGSIVYPLFIEARLGNEFFDPKAATNLLVSEESRVQLAQAGLTMFFSAPIFGVGFGIFSFLSPSFVAGSVATASHNQFISILAEQGVVGTAMVAGIILIVVTRLLKSRHPLRAAALAMFAAYLIQSAFINSTTSFQISGLTWLAIAAALSASGRDGNPELQEE